MPAARMNQGKPLFSFILDFPKALLAFCRVMEVGAIKYERDNWKKGGKPDEEYLDAALRHLVDLKNGEQFAKDTGCHHAAAAAWNLFALLELNVDEVEAPDLFKAACEHWRLRKGFLKGDDTTSVDRLILGHIHADITQQASDTNSCTEMDGDDMLDRLCDGLRG